MLVAAFEVDVGRPRQLGPDRQHRLVARAGVEPDVEDVHLALERRAAARRARQARRARTPRSAARTRRRRRSVSNTRGGLLDERRRQRSPRRTSCSRRAGIGTPHDALARDAPVGPVRDHVVDAVVAPRRDPADRRGRSRRAPPRAACARASPDRQPPVRRPCAMNHCDVARKITGLWQRQQCGY